MSALEIVFAALVGGALVVLAWALLETRRQLDPADPVKYDFALCHTRMRGDCLDRRDARVCPA